MLNVTPSAKPTKPRRGKLKTGTVGRGECDILAIQQRRKKEKGNQRRWQLDQRGSYIHLVVARSRLLSTTVILCLIPTSNMCGDFKQQQWSANRHIWIAWRSAVRRETVMKRMTMCRETLQYGTELIKYLNIALQIAAGDRIVNVIVFNFCYLSCLCRCHRCCCWY